VSCFSRDAFQLTVMKLFTVDLWNQNPSCYLHTLTFPDPEPTVDEAMRRFHSFAVEIHKRGMVCVRVIERGGQHGRVHYHLVSAQRWDVRETRALLVGRGFGRYDVRVRPVERAYYAGKYIGKKSWRFPLPRGCRSWGAVGVDPVRAVDVLVKKREIHLVRNRFEGLFDWWAVRLSCGTESIPIRLRAEGGPPSSENMKLLKLKPHQEKEVLLRQGRGEVGCFGEYRSCDVQVREIADKLNPANRIKRVLVEHTVECGGKSLLVQEWLPPGTSESLVKAPAECGDMVYAKLDRMDSKFGSQKVGVGTVFSLMVLPLS